MTQDELNKELHLHKMWLAGEKGGVRADLHGADLHRLDMHTANLCGADLQGANLYGVDLQYVNLWDANLQHTELRTANLRGADLRYTDLKGANIDYSCLPLWCGSLGAHFDDRELKQIAYYLVCAGLQSKNASPETKRELEKLIDFANGFHHVYECGRIEWEDEK